MYTLLAYKDPFGSDYIENEQGLSTSRCLSFLTQKRIPAYNVWFSFGYDVNMIMGDIPLDRERHSRRELWETGGTYWHDYRLDYTRRKLFTVSNKRFGGSYHAADAWGFFQSTFVKACKDWKLDPSSILEGKEARIDLSQWPMEKIRRYNELELDLFLELMNRLREALYVANLVPQSWHGPGAIAGEWLRKHNFGGMVAEKIVVKEKTVVQMKPTGHYGSWPNEMQIPIMHGYFGGRIDVSALGEMRLFKNDIASAYPAGFCDCIRLADIVWKRSGKARLSDRHALYHVSWTVPRGSDWGPFPWRDYRGVVLYPWNGEGWYWGVEVLAAERAFPGCVKRLEAWYPHGEKTFPFDKPLRETYKLRAQWKKEGNAANIPLKLCYNSIYGKGAQHESRHGQPRWQNYIWAGYTTAWTRAKILDVLVEVGQSNLVTVATDGIMTRVPLQHANETNELGTWQNEGFVTALIVCPGLYWTTKNSEDDVEDNATVYKQRGMSSNLNFGWVLRSWGCTTKIDVRDTDGNIMPNTNIASHRTFVGMGRALHTSLPVNHFVDETRTLNNVTESGTSKRLPNAIAYMEHVANQVPWLVFPMSAKSRREHVISYPYKWRKEFTDSDAE
jgi:hypothetical protein